MKFKELSQATADAARNALTAAIVNASPTTKEKLEMIAEGIAAAFIKLEHFDGAPMSVMMVFDRPYTIFNPLIALPADLVTSTGSNFLQNQLLL
jgi:hypothetical protein